MTLDALQSEMVQAIKNQDKTRRLVLAGMIDAVKKASMTNKGRIEITEPLVDEVLLKYKKMVQEMIDTCPADRIETLADYVKQFDIVDEFAPKIITDKDEIKELITDLTTQNNIELIKSNRGAIMKVLAANLNGKADMGIVSKVVGGMLA